MIDAFIFDLDGVITDTAEYHYLAWKELANKIGIEIDREFNETLKGVSRMESLERILVHGNKKNDFTIEEKEKMANDKNMYYVSLIENITPKDILPGISKLLENIKSNNIKIGLASASKNANMVLNNLKLVNYFDFIADASKCKNSKPAPDIFLMALKGLNVEAKNCIGIEDASVSYTHLIGRAIPFIIPNIDNDEAVEEPYLLSASGISKSSIVLSPVWI